MPKTKFERRGRRAALTSKQVEIIRDLYENGQTDDGYPMTSTELAQRFKVTPTTILRAVYGEGPYSKEKMKG